MTEEHKAHEHKTHIAHKHSKQSKFVIKKSDLWKFISYGLGAVLVISLIFNFIPGGESCEIDDMIVSIDSITSMTQSVETKASLGEIKEKLLDVSSELAAEKPTDDISDKGPYAGDKVKLEFYVMSQCPYGTQVMDAIAPVLKKLGDAVDFEANYISTDLGGGSFSSLHGEPETKGNIVQLCAAKYNPDKYMDMIVCQDKNAGAIPDNWESCAEDNGLDVESIRTCYEGDEGNQLLSDSIKKSQAAGASGSPTIYLNDQPYSGGRGENDFLRAICNAFTDGRPDTCSEIPEPTKVNMILLNDKRCSDCDATGLVGSLMGIFPGMNVRNIDYSSDEGKELFESAGLTALPAVLFDDTVEGGEGYANVQRYLVPAGDYTSLMVGAVFDPTKEICDNEEDDTGNDLVDCDDPDCDGALECREEIENHLQVFIMSDCPYGRKAVEALKGVVDNFGDNLDYEIHYIANEAGDGFSSLHGQYEVDEDIVQLCVKEKSPEQWFDYVYCRSVNGVNGVDWKGCAEDSDVDVDAVQDCFDGDEGKDLLREDIKIADALNIGASPTWMANNRYQFSGIDSETVKSSFCSYNLDVDGCENTLSSDTGGVAAGNC